MAVVPDTHVFTNGVLDSSELNTYVRDPIRFLLNKPICELKQIVSQSPITSTWTSITFTSEVVDTDVDGVGGHDTSSNTSRFTARYAGWYWLGGGVGFAPNVTGQRAVRWAVNGTALDGASVFTAAGGALGEALPARGKLTYLSVGDYVELQGWQSTGGALATVATGEHSCTMALMWERNA
jgi:hypothetical protein